MMDGIRVARCLVSAVCVITLFMFLASPLFADDRRDDDDRDKDDDDGDQKVRLLSVDIAPRVLVLGEASVAATARVALRATDERAPDDHRNARKHRHFVELLWSFTDQRPVLVTRATTDVVPPYQFLDHRKKWVVVSIRSVFNGTAGGRTIGEGLRPYQFLAHLWREKLRSSEKAKLVDSSKTLSGSLQISRRPSPVSVDPFPSTTNVPLITITGQKQTLTSLIVSGVERVALSASTTWSTTKTLVEGVANDIPISARNAVGLESLPVTVTVTLRSTPPAPPVVSVLKAYTNSRTVTMSGSKEPGSAILVDSVVRVPLDSSTTWSVTIQLQENENRFVIEAQDAAGNRSLPAGSHLAGVANEKPVIRDLEVEPAEVATGQTVQVRYRLFAVVPPAEQADLRVHVRVEDGDRLVKTLVAGIQEGRPDGPAYSTAWDGTDLSGHAVVPNATYKIVASADRVAATTRPRELVDANPRETALVVVGSRHVTSPDVKLEVVFRPDDAKLSIEAYPALTPLASRLLTSRGLHPRGCYRIKVDRPLTGSSVGVLSCTEASDSLLRPFLFDNLQQDWQPVARTNWNPRTRRLSFALPGPGLVVFATTNDVDQPYLTGVSLVGGRLTAQIRDDSSGLVPEKLGLRRGASDLSGGLSRRLVNGVHHIEVVREGVDSLTGLSLYAEDWAGHGRLFFLGGGTAP